MDWAASSVCDLYKSRWAKAAKIDTTQDYTRVGIDDLQKSLSRTAPGKRRQEGAFIPFNRQTAAWRQEKRRKRKG